MLVIKKAGILFDDENKEDVSDIAPRFLFDACNIEAGVTLKDVFILLNKHLELFDFLFGNWTKELVNEGLREMPRESVTNIEYLELSKHLESWKYENEAVRELDGMNSVNFHGVGKDKTGNLIDYGVSFSFIPDIIHLPVKLKNEVSLMEYEGINNHCTKDIGTSEFMLYEIFYGIIWDLSFYGCPSDRDKKYKELKELCV